MPGKEKVGREMNHWIQAYNIIVGSNLERPYKRDELVEYLKDALVPATETHAEGVLDYWIEEGQTRTLTL